MYENLTASYTCLMWTAAEFSRAGDDFSIGRAGRKIMGHNIKIWSTRTVLARVRIFEYEYGRYEYLNSTD